jgi:hypothetical protein
VCEQAVDHLLDGDSFGLGPVADKDAVPQRGMHEGPDVVDGGVIAAV